VVVTRRTFPDRLSEAFNVEQRVDDPSRGGLVVGVKLGSRREGNRGSAEMTDVTWDMGIRLAAVNSALLAAGLSEWTVPCAAFAKAAVKNDFDWDGMLLLMEDAVRELNYGEEGRSGTTRRRRRR
jgi:hypothetical protein